MSLRQRTADKNLNLYSESLTKLSNGSSGTCLIYFFKLCVLPLSFHDLVTRSNFWVCGQYIHI